MTDYINDDEDPLSSENAYARLKQQFIAVLHRFEIDAHLSPLSVVVPSHVIRAAMYNAIQEFVAFRPGIEEYKK